LPERGGGKGGKEEGEGRNSGLRGESIFVEPVL
jgi:hypothetical protein